MRLFLATLLVLVSCGKTDHDSQAAHAGNGGRATAHAGSPAAAGSPSAGALSTDGIAGTLVGGSASGGAGGVASGAGGTANPDGMTTAGAAGEGGDAGSVDLSDYACEMYSLGECLDGSQSQSYACCPLEGDKPCLTGMRSSNGTDARCGKASCYCEEQAFYESCYGHGSPCREPAKCQVVWQHKHVFQGEQPGAGFTDYASQISLDSVNCGGIGIGLDNHRVGTFIVNGLDDCWRRGTTVKSQMLIGTASGSFELETDPQTTPPFQAFAGRLEIDILRVAWDTDSLLFDVTWRAVACQ